MRSVLNTIKKFDLEVATKRPLPLFTLSCIGKTYVDVLKKKYFKCNYEAVAGWGDKNGFVSLLNEEAVVDTMANKLKKEKDIKKKFVVPLQTNFVKFKKEFNVLLSNLGRKNALLSLKLLSKYYIDYLVILGSLNCLWRYIGDNAVTKCNKKDIEYFAKARGNVAEIYPQMEGALSLLCNKIGEQQKFDGDLLRYFTRAELDNFLDKKELLNLEKQQKLKKRKVGYFYIYTKNTEEVVTEDNVLIKKIKQFALKNSQPKSGLKGTVVYLGKVEAKVFNFDQNFKKAPAGKFILVTHMTHPKDLTLIKKSLGIITDEGGVLCHAAIMARELKKPCIIGTKVATQLLKTGMSVELDCYKGTIKIIKK